MRSPVFSLLAGLVVAAGVPSVGLAHETGAPHGPETLLPAVPMKFRVEKSGPVRAPKPSTRADVPRVSGQGFWKFAPVPGLTPVPPEAQAFVKGAHGTVVFDPARDEVHWGLSRVGWVTFSDGLKKSRVIKQDAAFASGNIHGGDVLRRRGQPSLVVTADNAEGEIYLSDTSFQSPQKLGIPAGGPYADGKGWAPTDAAFAGKDRVYVVDGYGRAYFMAATVSPFAYAGPFHGGKPISQIPHGITFDAARNELYISARPEGQVREWSMKKQDWLAVHQLPKGSTACDADLWGDYLVVPCLDGPNQTPGPLYILNIKTRSIVSVIKPKEELGFDSADHLHGACWYTTGKGRSREVYLVFTAWNPGGIGAVKLVNVPD